MRKLSLSLMALAGLSACAAVDPYASYSGRLQPAAVEVVSKDVAQYVAQTLPPGKSVIWVRPSVHAKNKVGLDLEAALRERGLGVAPSNAARPNDAHELRYFIEPDGAGATARILLDGRLASRWYGTTQTGAVAPAGPFIVYDGGTP